MVSTRVVGRYTLIRSTRGLPAVADGKGTILSFIYFLLFKEKTPAKGKKLQTLGTFRGSSEGCDW
ncbi:MAG TPA: hypothetical protein VFO40_00240 [Chthoniobacterales bacterium]|nr:hypothetical protein [Chthoniobacterales bacterium]